MVMNLDSIEREITLILEETLNVYSFNIIRRIDQQNRRLEVFTNAFKMKDYDKNLVVTITFTDDIWLTCTLAFGKLKKNELNLFLVNEMNRAEPMLTCFIDEENVLKVKCPIPVVNPDKVSAQVASTLLIVVNTLASNGVLKLLMKNMN